MITGKVQGGKTTYLGELVKDLKEKGCDVAGFLCPGHFKEGVRSGFTLMNVRDASTVLMATIDIHQNWPRYGRFCFNPEAMQAGKKIIREAIEQKIALVIVDEVGPFELEGGGWTEALDLLQKESDAVQIWVVREAILAEVMERWEIQAERVIHISREEKEETLKKIISHVRNNESSTAE